MNEPTITEIVQDMLVQYTGWVNGYPVPWNVKKAEGIAALEQYALRQQIAELERLIQPSAIHGHFMRFSGNDIADRIKTLQAKLIKEKEL